MPVTESRADRTSLSALKLDYLCKELNGGTYGIRKHSADNGKPFSFNSRMDSSSINHTLFRTKTLSSGSHVLQQNHRNGMHLSSTSALNAEKRMVNRTREVLISSGMDHTERLVEREFDRITAAAARDLDTYPCFHRILTDLTIKLDEDYKESSEVPPSLPSWMPIIESIARIKHSGDSMIATMLGEVNYPAHRAGHLKKLK